MIIVNKIDLPGQQPRHWMPLLRPATPATCHDRGPPNTFKAFLIISLKYLAGKVAPRAGAVAGLTYPRSFLQVEQPENKSDIPTVSSEHGRK